MPEQVLRRNARIVFRKLDQESGGVLLHLDTAEYRHVNETGALIWSLLERESTREELFEELSRVVSDPPPNMREEVEAFLAALEERGLITQVSLDD